MSFLDRVLEKPSYGYLKDDKLYVPSPKEIWKEFFYRLNIFKTKKHWLNLVGWGTTCILFVPLIIFLVKYFSWPLLLLGFFYSMFIMGTHGTVYYHRYSTHRAFQFKNRFSRFLVRNLVIKVIPEETYVISHHVHHHISERPGDPYNVNAGWLYCFLADVIHQPIEKHLTRDEYRRLKGMLSHTGVHINSYVQYLKWGSLCHPLHTFLHFALNWAFWYGAFFLIGGHALATSLFGAAGYWAIGIRTFNFDGHGGGKDKRKSGVDFNRKDLSINQSWPGLVTGEWHNNHHLYPNSARAGFLSYQLDYAWWFIRCFYFLGGISTYRCSKEEFMNQHYRPYWKNNKKGESYGRN